MNADRWTGAERGRGPVRGAHHQAEERAKEAVVWKEARVKEELVIRKDVEERTETVKDTVRRTEVDVEDARGARDVGAGTTRTPNDRGRV